MHALDGGFKLGGWGEEIDRAGQDEHVRPLHFLFDFLLIVPDDAFAVSPAVAVFAAKAAADGHAADGKFDDVVARFFSASFESGGEGARISMRPCAAVQDEDSQSLYTSFAKLNAAHAFGQPA